MKSGRSVKNCLVCNSSKITQLDWIDVFSFYRKVQKQRGLPTRIPKKTRNLRFTILKCKSCNLVFSDPMIAGDKKFYQYIYKKMPPTGVRWEFKIFIKKIHQWLNQLKTRPSILDIGCGDGSFVKLCLKYKFNCKGLDFNADRLAFAAKSGGKKQNFINSNLNSFGSKIKKNEYNIFTMWHVLEHCCDPLSVIQNIAKNSNPGAFLAISVPSDKYIVEKISEVNILQYPPHHLTRWSKTSLQLLGSKYDYSLIHHQYEPKIGACLGLASRIATYIIVKQEPRILLSLLKIKKINEKLIAPTIEDFKKGLSFSEKIIKNLILITIFPVLWLKGFSATGMAQFSFFRKN